MRTGREGELKGERGREVKGGKLEGGKEGKLM